MQRNRCRPTVSNETVLATKQEFFSTKVAPVQSSITDIVLLGFQLILLSWMFISCYTTIYFFVKYFFCNVHISVNTIVKSSYLYFGLEIEHLLSTYAIRVIEGVTQNVYTVQVLQVQKSWKISQKIRTYQVDCPNKCCETLFVYWYVQVQ